MRKNPDGISFRPLNMKRIEEFYYKIKMAETEEERYKIADDFMKYLML
jgi:hypothetical protein